MSDSQYREQNRGKEKLLTWLLGLIVFALPAYLWRFNIGVPTTALEISIYIFTLVGLIVCRQNLRVVWQDLRRLKAWLWPIGVFVAAATLSVFISPDRRAALGLWKAYFVDPLFIFFAVVLLIRSSRSRRIVLGAMGLSVVVLGVWAVLQRIGFLGSPEPWINENPMRITAVFEYPNALGLYCAPITALFAGLLILGKGLSWRERIFCSIVILAGIIACYLSVSEGALVGIASAVIFAALLSSYRKWVVAFLLLAVVGACLCSPTRNIISEQLSPANYSLQSRLEIWGQSWEIIKDHWMTGVGLAGVRSINETEYRFPMYTWLIYPHNFVLNFWMEIGILGLGAFTWLVVMFFVTGGTIWRLRKQYSVVLIGGLLTAMVALIIHGLVDVPYLKNDLAVMFWVFTGLMVGMAEESGNYCSGQE